MIDVINKSAFSWNFNEEDWFINLVLSDPNIRFRIFTLKNYSVQKINDIVIDIYRKVSEFRLQLEKESQSFINKKNYLIQCEDNSKIQVTLEDEYRLKDLIEKYKIYELIGWFHLGKNSKIFKHCTLEKQEILEQIYPIIDLSIRKVIGSKVFGPYTEEFEEAVNNAWLAIIKYLSKIDTSKVMFSIFVGIAHRSAIYYNAANLKEKYNVVRINDMENNGEENNMNEDSFVNTVISNNAESRMDCSDIEDDILDEIESLNFEETYYLNEYDKDIDDIVSSIENPDKMPYLQQTILAYSYNILSGKIKKMCFEKIFAEFFNDLVNSKISEKVIDKHADILMKIMNLVTINPDLVHDIEANNQIYKLFKDWIKEKIENKLNKYNLRLDNKTDDIKKEYIDEIIKREEAILIYLKENKNQLISKLISFKSDCLNFKM